MNAHSGPLTLPTAIDLAREPAFRLGTLEVRPATREAFAPTRRDVLEPRVMQVLVVLAQAGGAVVSRDALVDRCWGGRIVGDDAVNRCVQRLRRLGREAGHAFEIETIARVGYRLEASDAEPEKLVGRRRRTRGAWIASAVLLMGALAGGLAWWFQERPLVANQAQPLVATPALELAPAVSPNGATLAYVTTDGERLRIRLRGVDGGDPVAVASAPGRDDLSPAWSPTGDRIAFVAAERGRPCRILVMRPPQDRPREVGACRTVGFTRLAWARSGDALYFSDQSDGAGPHRIVRLDLASGAQADVTRPPPGWGDYQGAPSADSRWLAIGRRRNFDLMTMVVRDLRSGRERVIAEDAAGFAWSMDGRTLFVSRNTAGSGYGVWAYAPASGRGRLLLPSAEPVGRLAAAPSWLAYETHTARTNPVMAPAVGETAYRNLDPAKGETSGLSYRGDGVLAVSSNRSGRAEVWLIEPGGTARILTSARGQSAYSPRWSPDGRRLAVPILADNRFWVHIYSAEGGLLAKVPAPSEDIDDPAWSADGRAVLIPARDARGWRVWRHVLDGRATFAPLGYPGWRFIHQSGGDLFAEQEGTGAIWRLTGQPREVVAARQRRAVVAAGQRAAGGAWTVRNGRVIYLDARDDAHARVVAAPVAGGRTTILADAPSVVTSSDVDIDPRSDRPVYIARVGEDYDIGRLNLARASR